jgi:hypothetical protein
MEHIFLFDTVTFRRMQISNMAAMQNKYLTPGLLVTTLDHRRLPLQSLHGSGIQQLILHKNVIGIY